MAGLLVIVGGGGCVGCSQIILLSATEPPGRFLSETCAQTRKVRSQAVLLIVTEFIPRRSKLNCVLILHQNSPSVCHHSSPVSIREVIPKCLSPENHGEYQAPASTERVMAQSTVRENHVSVGVHAEPADRAVTCP